MTWRSACIGAVMSAATIGLGIDEAVADHRFSPLTQHGVYRQTEQYYRDSYRHGGYPSYRPLPGPHCAPRYVPPVDICRRPVRPPCAVTGVPVYGGFRGGYPIPPHGPYGYGGRGWRW